MKQERKRAGLAEGWLIIAAVALVLLFSLLDGLDRLPRATVVEPVRSVSVEALATPEPEKLNLNAATAQELAQLPGIGEMLAKRIVQYRSANGPFTDVDGLDGVPGIGEGKIAALRELVICGKTE